MATSVKVTQTRSVPPVGDPHEGEYKLDSVFSEATTDVGGPGNWDNAFSLVKIVDTADASKDEYQHVCTVGDLEAYHNTRAAAVSAGHEYYRAISVTRYFENIELMDEAKTVEQTRTQELVVDWDAYQGTGWPTTEVNTYSS